MFNELKFYAIKKVVFHEILILIQIITNILDALKKFIYVFNNLL